MSTRLATPSDIARLLVVASAGCASHLIPISADESLTAVAFDLMKITKPGHVARSRRRMNEILGSTRCAEQIEALLRENYRLRVEGSWGRIRLIHGEKWAARITLHGVEHLEQARRRAKGAIVWRMNCGDALVGHTGCAQAGFPLTHLSTFQHGSGRSQTRLALQVNAPIFSKSEERTLKERVVRGPSGSLAYLRTIARRLASNEVVSIAGENYGRQAVETRFFGRPFWIAPGAPSLAWHTDASLLVMHAIWTAPYRYEVFISDPLTVDRQQSRRSWVEAAVVEFAKRLESHVSAHPSSWMSWCLERHPFWDRRC